MKHTKITQKERELLSQWKKEGLSNKQCAKRLGRHVATIGRELARNKTRVTVGKDWEMVYEPIHAHHVAIERKQNAWFAKHPLKDYGVPLCQDSKRLIFRLSFPPFQNRFQPVFCS